MIECGSTFNTNFLLKMMDKMIGDKIKKRSYIPDDPYEPYHNFKPPNQVYKTYK